MSGRVVKSSSGRVLTVAALLLCMGAFETVAVSLACFLYMPVAQKTRGNGISFGDAQAARPLSVNFEASDLSTGFGVTMRMDYWYWVTEQHSPMAVGLTSCAVGWPMRAFESPDPGFQGATTQAEFARAQTAAMSRPHSTKLPKFLHARPYRAFPTAIRPLGLAVDAVAFGGATALLWFGLATVRSARRRRAGRCLTCGYPVGGLSRCPECGRAGIVALIAALLMPAVFLGCSYNGSPLYSQLPRAEIEQTVQGRFTVGMPYDDVEDAIRGLKLSHDHCLLPSRDGRAPERGIAAYVERAGVSLDPYHRTTDGWLYFWFSGDQRLDEVAFRPPREQRDDDPAGTVVLMKGGQR
jgi:hypothetical protein